MEFSNYAIDYLAEHGYDPQFGARPLKRLIQKAIANQLSKKILSGEVDKTKTVIINVIDNTVVPDTVDGTFSELISGYYSVNFDYEDFRFKQLFEIKVPVLNGNGSDVSLPFNLVVIPNDYLGNGNYFLSSGIKTSFYNTEQVPYSIDNITGYINCTQNVFDKSLDIQAIAKWNAIRSENALSFEAYIYENGDDDNSSYVLTSNNPKVESINSIIFISCYKLINSNIISLKLPSLSLNS